MKVKNVIQHTVWRPGSLYGRRPVPAVSVLLPTYCRARHGLFRRAVASILSQTLHNLELIIVDDASTDGTAQQIEEFMRSDGRVSCLRHPRNIGLPAISEYEAFLKARADYLAFAFDDDLFYPDALARLLRYAEANPGKICFGHVVVRIIEKWNTMTQSINLGTDLSKHNIRTRNCIPNNAVLMPRSVIEDVGFYDPHVILARVCDWDLWRRASEKYLLEYVGVPVGEVTGPATADSIGKTYFLDGWASEEWMRSRRNHKLRPDSFCEYEIFGADTTHSENTQTACRDLSQHHSQNRPWLGSAASGDRLDGQILVANVSHDASTTIYFDSLPEKIQSHVRILQFRSDLDITELGRAGCLIVVRHLEPFRRLIDAALSLEVPCYYFLDDNFTLLQSENESDSAEDYSLDSLKRKLENFSGVLLSTRALRNFFEKHRVHSNLMVLPPCFMAMDPVVEPPSEPGPEASVTMAFIGGKHRQAGLKSAVMPAIAALAKKGVSVHLVIGGTDDALLHDVKRFTDPNLKITCEPFEVDWKRSLLKVAGHHPHILIHAPSDSINNDYKTLHIAASAWLLNAVLLVPAHSPYEQLEGAGNAILVEHPFRWKSWFHALEDLLRETAAWDGIRRRNSEFCRTEFSGAAAEKVLIEILENSPPVGMATIENRLKDLFKIRETSTSAALDSTILSPQELQVNLWELARIRRRKRRSGLVRIFGAKEDLWDDILPAFDDIKRFADKYGFHRPGRLLQLTDSLHDREFVEYSLKFLPGVLKTVSAVFSTDGIQKGTIGLELLDKKGSAIFGATRDLSEVDLHGPVEFDLHELEIGEPVTYRLRLFARSPWPVYTFEFVQYSRWRVFRRSAAPFLRLDYR